MQLTFFDQTELTISSLPEGDFTEEEARFAERQHFQTISLGENRLRTETAAIYALSVIKMLQGY
ncbi:MAG: RsmE family RNA methyltransferase [Bacteroidota bacterium]